MTELVKVFDGHNVRIIDDEGNPWFVGRDVALLLGYSNPSDAIAMHCKGIVKSYPLCTPGGIQNIRVVSESDVYRLIMRSRLPDAERFEIWVMEDVLPSIRKTGSYVNTQSMREKSKKVRHQFTDTLKDHGCSKPIHYIKITTTMKSHAGIKSSKKKDDLSQIELGRIIAAEAIATVNLLIDDAKNYDECVPICQDAATTALIATTRKESKALDG